MKHAKDVQRAVATLHVAGAAKMTAKGRAQIATWLRKQADALQSEGDKYAARFRARYLCG
jgi:hypothetical protein